MTEANDDDAPTTRRYPRSTREAFPDERARWLEHPPRHHHVAIMVALAIAAAVVLAIAATL